VNIELIEEARLEFLAALLFYKRVDRKVGRRFKALVEDNSRVIAARPELYSLREGGYRRVNLRGFPYYLPYVVRGDTVWVLAVAHGSREPEYWVGRQERFR
jgi:plasmid stabilization system protein ParE